MRTIEEIIADVEADRLASIFEAAFARLGELGREGGEAVRAKLTGSDIFEIEEGLAQLDELYESAGQ
jgi:hypothetical protein